MRKETIRLTSGDICYYREGSGPYLLFFHGAIATPVAYFSLLNLLSQKYTVIAPTHSGHGNSSAINPVWTIQNFIEMYKEFIDILSFQPEIVMGHSFGGTIALLMGAQNIGNRIVVFGPAGLPVQLTPKAYVRALLEEAKFAIATRPDLTYLKTTLPTAGTLVHTLIRHPRDIPWFIATTPQLDIRKELVKICMPSALIWGENDTIVPLAVGQKMHKLIPNSTLTILPAFGHAFPVVAPEITFESIEKILAS